MPKMGLYRVHFSLVMILAVTIYAGTKLSCPKGNYGIVLTSGILICKSCSFISKCPHGMGMSTLVQCGDIIHQNTKLRCLHCIAGKNFSSTYDNSMCQPCQSTTCKPNEAFDGKCTVFPPRDTTQCNGKCVKGYHTKTDSVDDCTPCAKCYGPKAKRVKKCIADNEPSDRQCEVLTASPSPTGLPSPTVATEQHKVVITELAASKGKEDEEKSNTGYKAYGHPAMFGTFLVIISVAITCLLTIAWKKKCSKQKTSQNIESQQVVHPHQVQNSMVELEDVRETNHNDDGIASGFTDSSVKPSTILKKNRANSFGVGKRKVSFSHEQSISASEKSEEREALVPRRSASVTDDDFNTNDDVPTTSATAGQSVRKRSLSSSSSSAGKKRLSLSRQNSNPGSTNENESELTNGVRKSKTFSSFSSLLGPKGTAEETTPILSPDSNGKDFPLRINMTNMISDQDSSQDPTTKKPSQLNAEVYRDVCLKLNQDIEGKDWQALAGRMGYTNEVVKNLKLEKDPADALLSSWQTKSGNDVKKLIEYLRDMERNDVIELLEKSNP